MRRPECRATRSIGVLPQSVLPGEMSAYNGDSPATHLELTTMSDNRITRRRVLESAAAGAALGLWGFGGKLMMAAETPSPVKILEPFPGAVLSHRHGTQTEKGLTIRVFGGARPGNRVTVNGVPCRREGKRFEADVLLTKPETDLVAVAEGEDGRHEDRVRVVWDRYSEPRYRFAIDDNSFFCAILPRRTTSRCSTAFT